MILAFSDLRKVIKGVVLSHHSVSEPKNTIDIYFYSPAVITIVAFTANTNAKGQIMELHLEVSFYINIKSMCTDIHIFIRTDMR